MRDAVPAATIYLLVAAAFLALLWAAQRRLVYFPAGHVPVPAQLGLTGVERVTFETADGLSLHAWFVRTEAPVRATLMVFNGNAGHRAYRAPLAVALRPHGIQTLLVDYRGYGDNPGSPTERGLAADSRAALAYVRGRPDVDPSRIVYFGESLGSGVAVDLAVDHPPAALILRSPFTSLVDVGRHHYPFLPVRWLLRDRFPSIERIGSIRVPLLVVAGDRDRIVPLANTRRLYDAAPEPKRLVVVEGADHNSRELFVGDELIGAIVAVIEEIE